MARTAFRFRLERLLDVRIMREKQAQQELQARRLQAQAEEQRLVDLQHREQQLREEQRAPFRRGEDLHEFQMRRHFLERAINESLQEQERQRGRIATAHQRVAEQIQVVTQAGIDVKALEKLKEKQREEHRIDQLREEGLFLDDLAGQGFLRRRALAERIAAEEDAVHAAMLEAPPAPPASAPPPPHDTREAAS